MRGDAPPLFSDTPDFHAMPVHNADIPMPTLSQEIGMEEKVACLQTPERYPEPVQSIETIETHAAWVFLTDRHVYKMKKPVRLEDMDFRTLAARHRVCRTEVVLNRRLAPDVYLGLQTLRVDPNGRLHLGPDRPPSTVDEEVDEEIVEWLIKMRRLPEHRMLDTALKRGTAEREHLVQVGEVLACFYRDARLVKLRAATYWRRLREDVSRNRRALLRAAHHLSSDRIREVAVALNAVLHHERDRFDARVRGDRIVDGHGDLRPEHVCLESPPVVIDCLEFSRDLRILDPVDELSFLALECERLGAEWVGPVVFDTYQAITGDHPSPHLRAFYACRNAYQRARLSARHLETHDTRKEPEVWVRQARDYLDCAFARLPAL